MTTLPKIKSKKTYWVDLYRGIGAGFFFNGLRGVPELEIDGTGRLGFVKTISFDIEEEREVRVGDSFECSISDHQLESIGIGTTWISMPDQHNIKARLVIEEIKE